MNTEHHRNPSGNRLEEILAEYLRAEEAGQAPGRAEWLEHYPELADELAIFYDNRRDIARLVGHSGEGPLNGCFGDYELLRELGRGGMGVVYQARQNRVGRTVALKMILAGKLASSSDVIRFRLEAEAAAQLDHPHIVPLYEVGERDGQHYFTMKLVEGGSLAEHRGRFRADPAAAALLVEKVAGAIHAAHRHGILHRDLKPANILLDREGQPHVTDFGLARRVGGDQHLTETGAVVGTARYMAPEQAGGRSQDLTTAVDIHSLGVILYELLTGAPPFLGATPLETLRLVQEKVPHSFRARNPGVDRDLEAICLKCLEKEPGDRYASAQDLAEDLRRWRCKEPVQARPVGSAGRLGRWCRRHPERVGLLAATGILFLIALATAVSVARSRAARLEEETLKANVYAARGVASTVLWQLDRLSQAVLDAAADPHLADLLTEHARLEEGGSPEAKGAVSQKLQERIRIVYQKYSNHSSSPFQSWHVLSRTGTLIADSVEHPRVIGDPYGKRDYFKSAKDRADQTGRASVHISCIYQSDNDGLHKFAIAVAVRGRPDGPMLGVIAATLTTTATLGALRLEDERRKVVLVGRQDPSSHARLGDRDTDDTYLVLLHPVYSRGDRAINLPGGRFQTFRRSQAGDEFALPDFANMPDPSMAMEANFEDPVGAYDERYRGRWLAGFSPVGNTEFVVIVQQRYDEAIGPEHALVWNMTFWAAAALTLGALLIGYTWRWWSIRFGG